MNARLQRIASCVSRLTPEQAALLISVGLLLGVFPIAGIPTLLCLLAAPTLRLSAAALQVLNNISTPLQLILLLPLRKIGAGLLGAESVRNLPIAAKLGLAAVHAVTGWFFLCVPATLLLYFVLVAAMRRRAVGTISSRENSRERLARQDRMADVAAIG